MAAVNQTFDVDKLTYDIFSILENKFLFGGFDDPKLSLSKTPSHKSTRHSNGKVRILSIDAGAATDGVLAANSLAHLERFLRRKSGNPDAYISDFFDVVAGSGAGGVLAALLFTRGKNGRPLFAADEALGFLVENRREFKQSSKSGSIFRRVFRSAGKAERLLRKTLGECTLKDTIKSVLIPCYDLATRAPFVFSRADALEMDGYDFKMSDVCLATSGACGPVEVRSVDQKTRILAVDGGIAMNNPTAAAITHVLNNKQEFPLCNGVEDLLVVSLGNGESDLGAEKLNSLPARSVRIAGEGASDMIDQAVSMAFGQCRTSNYVRIQANGMMVCKKQGGMEKARKTHKGGRDNDVLLSMTEEMLSQKNMESVLFKGKKIGEVSNMEKLEAFGAELMKEEDRRKNTILPTVVLKQTTTTTTTSSPSPRTSSATTLSSTSSSC